MNLLNRLAQDMKEAMKAGEKDRLRVLRSVLADLRNAGIEKGSGEAGDDPASRLDETDQISCPISHHFGVDDPVTPMTDVKVIQDAYAGRPNAEVIAHEGAEHNFAMPAKPTYDPVIAISARDSVLRCFAAM